MCNKFNLIASLKQFFKPKPRTPRWYRSFPKMSTQELEQIWEEFSNELLDPTQDINWRWQIRDKILPYIYKILHNRDE